MLLRSALCLGLTLVVGNVTAAGQVPSVKLYAMDCGTIEFKDMGFMSDTGEYAGKSARLVDPCFLIRHPQGNLLWDTGLGDALVGKAAAPNDMGVTLRVNVRLVDQLAAVALKPSDIAYIAMSHLHPDHTGNANLFTQATWIINEDELRWATQPKTPPLVAPASFSDYKTVATRLISADLDVFGDGRVRIIKTPGHTPGHQSLLVKLDKAGTVILSGDLYHLRSDRSPGNVMSSIVPAANTSRADTLASFARVEKLLETTRGRLIIQHDPEDFRALPKFPHYLD